MQSDSSLTTPFDASSPQEEVALATDTPANGWLQGYRLVGMLDQSPSGLCIGQQTHLDRRTASTGAEQRNKPSVLTLAHDVDSIGIENLW